MTIEYKITVGDFLTALTISGAIIGFVLSSIRDRRLRRKEYADRIRQAVADTVGSAERWAELAARLYDDIQALITETDMLLVKKQDVVAARDVFWRGLVEARAISSGRILDEKLDSGYVGLYGYAPNIHALYLTAMTALKKADEAAYDQLMAQTQEDIMQMPDNEKPFQSAALGNRLRHTTHKAKEQLALASTDIVSAFRLPMLELIKANDLEIFHKTYPPFVSVPQHKLGVEGEALIPDGTTGPVSRAPSIAPIEPEKAIGVVKSPRRLRR